MLQKHLLHQDVFLVGAPGPLRRRLAMAFCELMGREVEYVALTRDTTESDLKLRREIKGGSAVFEDQPPVKAALHGRVLILDGIEKAERNVLPTLNNLLENREMALDDGRFLVEAERYDRLVGEGHLGGGAGGGDGANGNSASLVRVHPDFAVIALGLPVPPYAGKTLDPPLRSRFQACHVASPASDAAALLQELTDAAPRAPPEALRALATFASTMELVHAAGLREGGGGGGSTPALRFPESALPSIVQTLTLGDGWLPAAGGGSGGSEAAKEGGLVGLLARSFPLASNAIPMPRGWEAHRRSVSMALEQQGFTGLAGQGGEGGEGGAQVTGAAMGWGEPLEWTTAAEAGKGAETGMMDGRFGAVRLTGTGGAGSDASLPRANLIPLGEMPPHATGDAAVGSYTTGSFSDSLVSLWGGGEGGGTGGERGET
jgi:hypothetical protein